MEMVEWVGGPVEQIGAHTDAGSDEGLRLRDAVQTLADGDVELEVAAEDVRDTGVGDHRPASTGVLS